jgi:hypothetical protein
MSTPTVKVTLSHASGVVSSYKPNTNNNVDQLGGLREAIVTCFSSHGDLSQRVELLRADIVGADWSAMDRAGGFPEMVARLQACATDLLDGHDPHVVVTLSDKRAMTDAHLVTNNEALAAELLDPNKRSLVVPRILPYQLGGTAEGATAVVFSPAAGGGLKLHSLHPNTGEAAVAEANLKAAGEARTGTLQVHTAVTSLLAAVDSGQFKPATATAAAAGERAAGTSRPHPGLMPSVLAAPTPFATR